MKKNIIAFTTLVFAVLAFSGCGGISEKERAALCLEVTQALTGSTGTMIALAFSGATDAKMEAYTDSIIENVAKANGRKYEADF